MIILPTGEELARLSTVNRARCKHIDGFNHPLEDLSPEQWCCAFMGEVGETCNVLHKIDEHKCGRRSGEYGHYVQQALDEVADSVIYLDILFQRMGIQLAGVAGFAQGRMETFWHLKRDKGLAHCGYEFARHAVGVIAAACDPGRSVLEMHEPAMLFLAQSGVISYKLAQRLWPRIVAKFNATSDKIGWQERLVV